MRSVASLTDQATEIRALRETLAGLRALQHRVTEVTDDAYTLLSRIEDDLTDQGGVPACELAVGDFVKAGGEWFQYLGTRNGDLELVDSSNGMRTFYPPGDDERFQREDPFV